MSNARTTPRPSKTFVLWGFHPAYKGQDGFPYPVPLAKGTLRECNGERRRRQNDDKRASSDTWTLATYAAGAPPVGLRLLCDKAYPDRTHEFEQ